MGNSEILQILANLTQQMAPFWELFHVFAYLAGGLTFTGSLMFLKSQGQTSQGNIRGGVVGIVCGLLLLALPAFLDALSMTIFEASAPQYLSSGGGSGPDAIFIRFCVGIVMLVGLWAVIKGILMLKAQALSAHGGISGQALVHMAMGILCINIQQLILIIGESAGGIVNDMAQKLFAG